MEFLDMWTYQQVDGLLSHNGEKICTGYSGFGDGKNNPAMQNVANMGPLPCGSYTIGAARDLQGGPHGPFVLPLTPSPNKPMFGAAGFLLHRDLNNQHGAASHGCLILPRQIRHIIYNSGDNHYTVHARAAAAPKF